MDKDLNSSKEIQQKIKELESILFQYKNDLGIQEKELFQTISEYKNALREEKIKELKQNLNP